MVVIIRIIINIKAKPRGDPFSEVRAKPRGERSFINEKHEREKQAVEAGGVRRVLSEIKRNIVEERMYMLVHYTLYVCIYIYIYTHIHIHVYVCIYLYTLMCIYVYIYIYIVYEPLVHVLRLFHNASNRYPMFVSCIHVYIYIYLYVYTHICTHVYVLLLIIRSMSM